MVWLAIDEDNFTPHIVSLYPDVPEMAVQEFVPLIVTHPNDKEYIIMKYT